MALTKQDKKDIGEIIGNAIAENNEVLADHFASKIELNQAIQDLKDELVSQMKTNKSEILDHIDAFSKEIKDNREQRTIQAEQVIRNTKRIEKLEEKALNI